MPIKDYTTKIDVYTTIGQIQGTLVKHGARRIMQEYDREGAPQTLCFEIETSYGFRAIRLPARVEGVQSTFQRDKVRADIAQAQRTAWRIIKDWVDAQMAFIDSMMTSMEEIFLPYMLADDNLTVFEMYKNQQLMLKGDNNAE